MTAVVLARHTPARRHVAGEFHNTRTRRVGTIFFDLRADSEVPVVLRFGALATYRGSLGGWLQPYRDPELSCWIDTWFEGRLVRDTLAGSFFTRRTDTDTVRAGTWWAARSQ